MQNMRIDWQILQYLKPIADEGMGPVSEPIETENNFFIYCHYYQRDNWYSDFHKRGCNHIEIITTNYPDFYFVVGYKFKL